MMTVNLENDTRAFAGRYVQAAGTKVQQYPQTLVEAVEMAVDQVDASWLCPITNADAGPAFQPRTMLGLLTFCYARQVYSSSDIAAQLRFELKPFWTNGIDLPDSLMLQRFRSENQGAITHCLKSTLVFLAEEKIRQGVVTHVKRAHLASEASRRIIMAMFTDSLEAPGEANPRSSNAGVLGVAIGFNRRH
jgi:hypothetical protein